MEEPDIKITNRITFSKLSLPLKIAIIGGFGYFIFGSLAFFAGFFSVF